MTSENIYREKEREIEREREEREERGERERERERAEATMDKLERPAYLTPGLSQPASSGRSTMIAADFSQVRRTSRPPTVYARSFRPAKIVQHTISQAVFDARKDRSSTLIFEIGEAKGESTTNGTVRSVRDSGYCATYGRHNGTFVVDQ